MNCEAVHPGPAEGRPGQGFSAVTGTPLRSEKTLFFLLIIITLQRFLSIRSALSRSGDLRPSSHLQPLRSHSDKRQAVRDERGLQAGVEQVLREGLVSRENRRCVVRTFAPQLASVGA